jgi:O-antigen ligase
MPAQLEAAEWTRLVGLVGLSMAVGLLAGVDPKLAIAAALGCGFMLLVFADLAAGLAAFGFLSFLELLQLGSEVSVAKLGGALLALSWLAVIFTRGEAKSDFMAVHPAMTMVLGLFLGWVALSVTWAENPGEALAALARYIPNALLFLIAFTAIRKRSQALLVVAALVAGAVTATAYGLLRPPDVYGERITGTNLDPNELASVLVAGVALSGAVAANLRGRPGLRQAAFAAGAFCVLGTFLTTSRGGLIALGALLVAAILFSGRWRPRVIVAASVIALATFYYFAVIAPPEARERIQHTTQGETRLLEGRTTIWQVAERAVAANPVKGVGGGNFKTASRHYLLQPGAVARSDLIIDTPLVAHNTYLQILAELGIVGLALFGAIILFSLRSALVAAQNFAAIGDRSGEALARGLSIALVGALVADFFISQEYNKQLWLLLALGPTILSVSRREQSAGRQLADGTR